MQYVVEQGFHILRECPVVAVEEHPLMTAYGCAGVDDSIAYLPRMDVIIWCHENGLKLNEMWFWDESMFGDSSLEWRLPTANLAAEFRLRFS